MEYSGDYETKLQAIASCLRNEVSIKHYNILDPDPADKMIEIYPWVLIEDKKTKKLILLYIHTAGEKGRYMYKLNDHTVGPVPEDYNCPLYIWKRFIKGPIEHPDGEFTKDFISRMYENQPQLSMVSHD